jgi:hypothetical protein
MFLRVRLKLLARLIILDERILSTSFSLVKAFKGYALLTYI